jgi:hypothetical protein
MNRHRLILLSIALLCAATRFLALAKSVWEWDEALLVLGMRDYNVGLHHPHPPGFPVFIALGHLFRFITPNDFRALQAINIVASLLVFPAVYCFARELKFRFEIAVMAGALFAFFPNVWLFGGGAFSDVPSIVLVLFAVTLLIRGAENRNAYWLGTLLLALAIGIRPQNFLVGLLPGIHATRKRRPHEILIALLIGLVVVGAAFGGAMYATGSAEQFISVVKQHGEYIARVDSWRNPDRPAMWRLIDRFFMRQYQSPVLSAIATLFVLVSLYGSIRDRSRPMFFAALAFVPFALFAWAMLDRYSISRFSIGYQPLFALLLADGIARAAKKYAPLAGAALLAGFAIFTIPALTPVRTEVAPSVQAARAVADQVDPRREQLLSGHSMSKFLDLVVPGFPYTRVSDDRALPLSSKPAWIVAEITETGEGGFVFRRERKNLWNIARHHYFEIKLQQAEHHPQFVSGWYEPESHDIWQWRWMSGQSTIVLPPGEGRTLLRMSLTAANEVSDQHATVTVKLNGAVLDTFQPNGEMLRDYRVTAAPNQQPNVLEISSDKTATKDGRVVSVKLQDLGWGPA